MQPTLEARANTLGIPTHIVIDDKLRYQECAAHAANLVSIEGKNAIYQGECGVGHHYDMEFTFEELRRMMHIENGEIVYGNAKAFEGGELEEM